jgi:hypothetical protein
MAIILIKVKSCKPLLLMLLVCIHSIIKSVLRYKFLILDIYQQDTLHLYEQGYEDLQLFFKDKRGTQKCLGPTPLGQLIAEYIIGMPTVSKTGLKHMLLALRSKIKVDVINMVDAT